MLLPDKMAVHIRELLRVRQDVELILICIDSERVDPTETERRAASIQRRLDELSRVPVRYTVVDHALEGWLACDKEAAAGSVLGSSRPRSTYEATREDHPTIGGQSPQAQCSERMVATSRKSRHDPEIAEHASPERIAATQPNVQAIRRDPRPCPISALTKSSLLQSPTWPERKTIYLANPYGFSAQQKTLLLPQLVEALEDLGLEVWEPFERNNQEDTAQAGWAYRIGQADFRDVRDSDAIFAVVNGVPPDEGVMVELGMAIALGKPTFLFRDDFRRVTDSEEYPLNLMLFTGIPEQGWRDFYYTSVAEIASQDKALARWARRE